MRVHRRRLYRITEKALVIAGVWFLAGFAVPPPTSIGITPDSIRPIVQSPIVAGGSWEFDAPEVAVVPQTAQIVTIAMRYIGVPYVHGGKTPRGFDCSGFTRWVYAQIGVTLPMSAAEQARAGRIVSASEARPGDLLAWPGHIGIYAGNGMRIDANHAGSTVQVRPIYGHPLYVQVLP